VIAALNPVAGLQHMLGHAFIRHGLIAGTAIAAAAGLIGYFLVLRSQVFTADALSHVAFTGALIALTLDVDARLGLFVATIGTGVLLALVTIWAALFVAFYSPYPLGFWLSSIAFGLYALTFAGTRVGQRLGARVPRPAPAVG